MNEIMMQAGIPRMDVAAIDRVRLAGNILGEQPQVVMPVQHLLHAGLYARTIRVPAGVALVGVEIRIATVLVVSGHCQIYTGQGVKEVSGYQVLPASAHRKQMIVAIADTDLTMIFPTEVGSVVEAEEAFSDEADQLQSRHGENTVIITGE